MLHRTFSTIILLGILFVAVYFGGVYGVVGLATLVTVLALFEYYRLSEHFGASPRKLIGLTVGACLIPMMYYGAAIGSLTQNIRYVFLAIAACVILFSLYLLKVQRIPAWMKQLSTMSGVVYLPFMVGFFAMLIGEFDLNGVFLCVWILLATKFTDVGGLLIGCSLGKHKLAPNISPNKTWEGAVGGLIFSMAVGAAVVFAFNHFNVWQFPAEKGFSFPVWLGAVGAIPFAVTSIISDLTESMIKRQAGDKDSGHTIPGMGGALDLLDSLVLVAPVGYVMVKFVVLA